MNDAKLLLAEDICIRTNEEQGLTVIESGAPILSALMFRVIHGPSFKIPDVEIPQDRSSLDIDCVLKLTVKVRFLTQTLEII